METTYISVAIAGATFFILYTVTVLGGAAWLQGQLKTLRIDILSDFNAKHLANEQSVRALEKLVMRHDILLEPEFKARGLHHDG